MRVIFVVELILVDSKYGVYCQHYLSYEYVFMLYVIISFLEKLCAVEERYKGIEKERDDLKRKCKEFEAKMDVLTR